MTKIKIYISGQITGLPFDEVQAKFAAAERILTEIGYEVILPLETGISYKFPWEIHIIVDILLLIACDAVYFLPDWDLSSTSTLERDIAELTGKQLIYEEEPMFTELKQAILEVLGVPFYEIVYSDRKIKHVYARMIYAHFRKEQGATITGIAAEIRRKHSTIIYYLKKFEDDKRFNPKFREIANRIETILSQGGNDSKFKLRPTDR